MHRRISVTLAAALLLGAWLPASSSSADEGSGPTRVLVPLPLPGAPSVATDARPPPSGQAALPQDACRKCRGTGQVPVDCPVCGNTGRCPPCGGQGLRPSHFRGGMSIMCVACRKTGRCSACTDLQTADRKTQVCPTCAGKGRRPSAGGSAAVSPAQTTGGRAARPLPAPPSPPPPPEDPAAVAKRATEAEQALRDYTNTMALLDARFTRKETQAADFEELLVEQADYVGMLLTSKVRLLQAHSKGVRVGGSPQAAQAGGRVLLPRSEAVSRRAEALLDSVKHGGEVLITYGAVNVDNLTLYDIQPAAPPKADANPPAPAPAKNES